MPLRAIIDNLACRFLDSGVEDQQPADAHPSHRFQVSGDTVLRHIPVAPAAIDPRTRRCRRVNEIPRHLCYVFDLNLGFLVLRRTGRCGKFRHNHQTDSESGYDIDSGGGDRHGWYNSGFI